MSISRRFVILLASASLCTSLANAAFQFKAVNDNSLELLENGKPVLTYNHGVLLKEGVPADRARSTYIHPLYGMDGEVLTDDFPKDHYHHRGLFWAWPHVKIGGKEYDLWMIKGVHQQFERFLKKDAGRKQAVLEVQNVWIAEGKPIVRETVKITAHTSQKDSRAIDLAFTWTPLHDSLTLVGAADKSYGGLTLRFAPRTNTVITTPAGQAAEDLPMTRLPWADLTGSYPGVKQPSGAAIFVPPSHPDYPPTWLTRHYGVLCLGWPGVDGQTFPAGKDIVCRYRVWIHRNQLTKEDLERVYKTYTDRL